MAMVESPKEERILVSVRVRPLNDKEVSGNDVSEWECLGNTVFFSSNQPDRTMTPSSYAFDRVFGWDSSTRQVYEHGAKEVALSVMSGINSTIFAYGQTSSGKTYTMKGITEFAITDIYDYIKKHSDKEFVLKFSAMEIYNEAVRDLLSSDTSAQLRLLDDPEKGTIIEKLSEEILSDRNHLQELLSVCEAQRKIGETSLNETSSRSHQILRLTVESSAREYLGFGSSGTLAATVNFVDLAGSERVSQALSTGTRLKEGCHINRSLLTLGTVIRKLSKGKNGHVPYRESKLTRILQNSLGGNARTAIICTMSPARSHAEQSKNTLFFASCAKEVTTNAKVNVVTSDKALVKQLQKELAKMEKALKSLESNSLKEKECLLEQMDREIKELTQQRDLAQSRVQNLLQSAEEGQVPRMGEISGSESLESHNQSSSKHNRQLSEVSEESFLLDSSIGFDLFQGLEDIAESEDTAQRSHAEAEDAAERCDAESEESCKEITCIQMVETSMDDKKESEGNLTTTVPMHEDAASSSQQVEALQQKINEMQKTINTLVSLGTSLDHSPCSSEASAGSSGLPRSRSCKANLMNPSASPSKVAEQNENATPAEGFRHRLPKSRPGVNSRRSSREDLPASVLSCLVDTDDTKKPEAFQRKISKSNYGVNFGNLTRKDSDQDSLFSLPLETQSAGGEDIVLDLPRTLKGSRWSLFKSKPASELGKPSRTSSQLDSVLSAPMAWKVIQNFSESDLEDNVSLLNFAEEQNEDQMYAASSRRHGRVDPVQRAFRTNSNWRLEFERQRGLIIALWDACFVPLVHRTHFFLLYKSDPSDSLYLEVELRRLSILKDTFINGSNVKDSQAPTPASSMKALKREREMLSKKVHKRFSKKERERVYQKWGIRLNTKQRSLQLANFLWTSTMDMGHIRESAALVAKLVGFVEPLEAPKEILGLSFLSRPIKKTSIWRDSMSTL